MELSILSTVTNGNLIGHSLDIENFSLDSRNIKQGDLYIALQGTNFDGHDFVEEAISKGASAAVVHKSIRSDIPHILVNDTYDFMKSVALFNRSNFEGEVIGITGTNGKTSTKQILSNLLDNNNECHKTSGNKNNQIGVPFSLLNLIKTSSTILIIFSSVTLKPLIKVLLIFNSFNFFFILGPPP